MAEALTAPPGAGRLRRLASPPILLFVALSAILVGSAPMDLSIMGYAAESIDAANALLGFRSPMVWPRHGLLEAFLNVPFVLVARLAGLPADQAGGVVVALPAIETAAIGALVLLLARRLGAAPRRAFVLAVGSVFGTLLWPYAGIGLEPTQSLALLAAAAIAFTPGRRTRGATILFAICSGVTLGVKLPGLLLSPAVRWAALHHFSPDRNDGEPRSAWRFDVALFVAITALLFAFGKWSADRAWGTGAAAFDSSIRSYWVDGPLAAASNFVSFLFGTNKGLLVFAPLAALGLLRIPFVAERRRPFPLFALLALLGYAGPLSILKTWSDETWGPRYLHAAVAPLVLCLAIPSPERRSRFLLRGGIGAALVVGTFVSALGSFAWYGRLWEGANRAGLSTLEALQHDPVWNHVRFNARLASAWIRAESPAFHSTDHFWWFEAPPGARDWPPVEITKVAKPLPVPLQWNELRSGRHRLYRWARTALTLAGIVMLGALARRQCRRA